MTSNQLHFNVYHRPTNSFSYLHYKRCHPLHTKTNIVLSIAKGIVQIITDHKTNQLQKLKDHLLKRKQPEKKIDYSFTK